MVHTESKDNNTNKYDTFSGFTRQNMKEESHLYITNTGTGAGLYSCAFINRESIKSLEVLQKNNTFKDGFGFLLGTYTGDEGLFRVWIEDVSDIFYEENNDKNITFSDNTWQSLKEELMVKRPDLSILGFYHIKPGKGSFLSEEDSFIHEKFFTSYWHISYQFDPIKKEHSFYGRDNLGNLSPLSFRAEGDELYIALTKEERDKIKPKRKKRNKKKLIVGKGLLAASFALILVALAFANHYLLITPLKDRINELEEIITAEGYQYPEEMEESGEGADEILPGMPTNGDEDATTSPVYEERDDLSEEDATTEGDYPETTDPDSPEDLSDFRTHTIVEGDNLWGISSQYLGDGSRFLEIAELNGMEPDAQLRVGEILIIPPQ